MKPYVKNQLFKVSIKLFIEIVLFSIILYLIYTKGSFFDNDSLREQIYTLIVGGLFSYTVLITMINYVFKSGRSKAIDNGKHNSKEKTYKVQYIAISACLLSWMIILTEAYFDSGFIPIIFPFYIFCSSIIISIISKDLFMIFNLNKHFKNAEE